MNRNQIYYVYRHIRLDTNEVFYIGKGTKNQKGKQERTVYRRAFERKGNLRSSYWHRITNKVDYEVEILFESNSEHFIFQKEKEFIKIYGRKDLGEGTLINFCDGGQGFSNKKMSETQKSQLFASSPYFGKSGGDHFNSVPVYAYFTSGAFYKKFSSRQEAANELKVSNSMIGAIIKGSVQQYKGITFFLDYQGETVLFELRPNKCFRKISCYDINMNLIQEFESVTSAVKRMGVPVSNIYRSLKKDIFCKQGYKFKFID